MHFCYLISHAFSLYFLGTYLLLIDDIWSAKTWESIRLCLPLENNRRSRIIVTSRFQAVGAACSTGTNNLLRTIEFLSVIESKNLFYQSV